MTDLPPPGGSDSDSDHARTAEELLRRAEQQYGTEANQNLPKSSYAMWLSRVGCFFGDAAIPAALFTLGTALGRPTYEVESQVGNTNAFEVTSSTGYGPLYYVFAAAAVIFIIWNRGYREGRTGRSVGKQLFGFATVRESTGRPLGVGLALLRIILLAADFAMCFIGVLWPLWDRKRQCLLSDKLTGAVVIPARTR